MPVGPTRTADLIFAGKVAGLRLRRGVIDALRPLPRLHASEATDGAIVAESRTPLWTDEGAAEHVYQLGKVQNLRVAAHALDGLRLAAGETFSFWRHVGPPMAWRGFVRGRMLRQGCLVPVVGGGLCQLSNALYDVALRAGCEIVERHAHSRVVPGSTAAEGRDATVAWNYVDLRFTPARDLRLTARLTHDQLIVGLAGMADGSAKSDRPPCATEPSLRPLARGCGSCGEIACPRHEAAHRFAAPRRARAVMVDEAWPEFRAYVAGVRDPRDLLLRPFDDGRFGPARYAWPGDDFADVRAAPVETAGRALALRTAADGPRRRQAELQATRRIALALASALPHEVTELVVAQSYLPFLWASGALGGRAITVLMTRPPMAALQRRLDHAAARHPERASLADFRAPAALVEAEAAALSEAVRIVTPHADIAAMFAGKAERLEWCATPARPAWGGPIRCIAFPGPTAARKGAYEVREAALALDLDVVPLGSELEGADFWRGVRIVQSTDWTQVDAVVQPALVEEQPRRLLAALAAGLPVFATPACGLMPQPGLTLIPSDDPQALIDALATPSLG